MAPPTIGASTSLAAVPCQLAPETVTSTAPGPRRVASSTQPNGEVPDVPRPSCGRRVELGGDALPVGAVVVDVVGPAARAGATVRRTASALPAVLCVHRGNRVKGRIYL